MPPLDYVTGLESRGALELLLAECLDGSQPHPETSRVLLAVVIVDVVGLKAVNEQHGFLAGDSMLRTAADSLRHASERTRLLARLGGDELVAVFSGPTAEADARKAVAILRNKSLKPLLRSTMTIAATPDSPSALIDRLYASVRGQSGQGGEEEVLKCRPAPARRVSLDAEKGATE